MAPSTWYRLLLLVLAVVAALTASAGLAILDGYLGRGAVWGGSTANLAPTAHVLGANTFLHLEADRANVDRTARMLREAGIVYVRQQFAWNEIEPAPGVFRDPATGESTWAKYDYIAAALEREGLRLLARIENTPDWARPDADARAAPFGPPDDYDRYARFAAQVVERYRGTVSAVQVWNEPNLRREWGEQPPDPAAYVDLLQRTYRAVKAVDPNVTVVAAGLAPTDGLDPGGMNELAFLDQMYEQGARGYFDAMAVMIYGLGQSPDDRRVGYREPINFSRPVLTREVMVRHGDGATPVWATEYGWVAIPPGWSGRPSTWGVSVSEERQADYLRRGIERAREEWPWMGVMTVWAFRFVASTMDPADPQEHFAIVRGDFSPRPAYEALKTRPSRDALTPGVYSVTAPDLHFEGVWEPQILGGRHYRIATPGARLRFLVRGEQVSLLVRQTVDGGRLSVTIDGQAPRSLPARGGRGVVSLRADRTSDASVDLARGLQPGTHLVEIVADDSGQVVIGGLVVSHERPFAWAFTWLHGAALAIVSLAVWRLLRWLARAAGYAPVLDTLAEGS